jgi:hypothetical protein
MDDDLIDSQFQEMLAGLERFAAIFSSIVGIAFVAFCIWLIVRVANRRERWAKRALAITLCLPVLYVASIGPFAWLEAHGYCGNWWVHCCVTCIYYPLIWVQQYGPDAVRDAILWYGGLWTG